MILRFLLFVLRIKEADMIALYATLIIKGKKTIDDVPATIKEAVREMLHDLDLGDLA